MKRPVAASKDETVNEFLLLASLAPPVPSRNMQRSIKWIERDESLLPILLHY